MKIALTRPTTRLEHYVNWLSGLGTDFTIDVLSAETHSLRIFLDEYHGLVLSGGVDIFPSFYGGKIVYPGAPDNFNLPRDLFEMRLYAEACRLGLPVMAICRGVQLVAVAEGNALIQDLETAGYACHRKRNDAEDGAHPVRVENSRFFGSEVILQVNSAHHQALLEAPSGFSITGRSLPDGVPEILERTQPSPFFLGLQWHPERLFLQPRSSSEASQIPLAVFGEAVRHYAQHGQ
jgi:putative glutamine amidotransferase